MFRKENQNPLPNSGKFANFQSQNIQNRKLSALDEHKDFFVNYIQNFQNKIKNDNNFRQ